MKIGIIGASSQVGSSIALYCKHFTNTDVVCLVRAAYSSSFFELFDIAYDRVDFNNQDTLKQQLSGCDAVIDCSFPAGQLYNILPAIKKSVETIIAAMPEKAIFIYMSSIMAYGMPPDQEYLEHYSIPRSSYAFIKRNAEKEVVRLCKKYSKKGYNFRLSQVHGFLQSVNGSFREKLSSASIAYISGPPQTPTNTIFINSVCAAIIKCVNAEVKPGLYTLVSQPQWTLAELYNYYVVNYNIDCRLEYLEELNKEKQKTTLTSSVIKRLKKYRPLLETYILMRSPGISIKFKGRYRQSEVYSAVNEVAVKTAIDFNLLGIPPFNKIDNINSSVQEVVAHEKEIETFYNKMITDNRR